MGGSTGPSVLGPRTVKTLLFAAIPGRHPGGDARNRRLKPPDHRTGKARPISIQLDEGSEEVAGFLGWERYELASRLVATTMVTNRAAS